ncbi:esterase-like activity of phytase family protein [Ferrovibrio sp.]|uniref:esterase-like activity of phytase family protein n=1 Tax=Ferrovibrio sp. TaxID=1917215 RepID=UPI00311D42F9
MTVLPQGKHLIILALLLAPPVTPVAAGPLPVRDAELVLDPQNPSLRQVGRLDYLGGLVLASEDSRFGGYSGLVVDPDGGGLWAISDTGHWLRLDFDTDAMGLPRHVARAEILPLRDAQGRILEDKRDSDAEALRRTADGGWLVAFEHRHRIWRYAEPGGRAVGVVALPDALAGQPANGGIEAMAVLSGDGLLLLSEGEVSATGRGAAWLHRGGQWWARSWPLADDFAPTDAVALPDGSVVVLERFYRPLAGPRARLRLLPPTQAAGPDQAWQPLLLAELARPYSVDNMEALDARPAADGSVWFYVMSDDNRNALQRTLLMVFRLQPQ